MISLDSYHPPALDLEGLDLKNHVIKKCRGTVQGDFPKEVLGAVTV